MADHPLWLQQGASDLRIAFSFLTRLPVSHREPVARGDVSRALWAAPVIGVVVGLIGGAAYWLAQAFHVPPLPAATLAVAATLLATGALHEDGLADVADGFGGGSTRERKLEIMRDSRIGTYGVCALMFSILLRIGALVNLGEPSLVAASLIAAHAAARAPLAAFMHLVPAARSDGMSVDAGVPLQSSVALAMALGVLALLLLGFQSAFIATIIITFGFAFMAWLCTRQINGQTGDVVGALEQFGEIAVLLVAAAAAQTIR